MQIPDVLMLIKDVLEMKFLTLNFLLSTNAPFISWILFLAYRQDTDFFCYWQQASENIMTAHWFIILEWVTEATGRLSDPDSEKEMFMTSTLKTFSTPYCGRKWSTGSGTASDSCN